MGTIIQPYCHHCKNEFKELLVGGGMMNFNTVCEVPSSCLNCKTVFSRNILKGNLKCPKCRRKVEYFGEISNEDTDKELVFEWMLGDYLNEEYFRLENKKYKCPQCEKTELVFFDCGNWD